MPPLVWDQSFNAGHREIDCQHKQLLAFVNEMESLFSTSWRYKTIARLNLLERLLTFAAKHFSLEREVMQKDGNSNTTIYDHWRSYKTFDAEIYTLYRELLAKRLVLDSDILTIIRNEFHNHISKEDNLMSQEVFPEKPRLTRQISGFSVVTGMPSEKIPGFFLS